MDNSIQRYIVSIEKKRDEFKQRAEAAERQLAECQTESELLFTSLSNRDEDVTRLEQERGIIQANLEYLSNAKSEIFDLFVDVREKFDDSEYQQGKKDGLRLALALLGFVEMSKFNRGAGLGMPFEGQQALGGEQ